MSNVKGLTLKALNEHHASQVLALEVAVFDEPWAERSIHNQLKHCRGFNCGLFDGQEQLLAYAAFSVLLDESELYRLAVHPSLRRQGIARAFMLNLFEQLKEKDVTRCLLEVNENNVAAVGLYEQLGFTVDGVRKGYYDGPEGPENAKLMTCVFSA